jgi:hypothetical protein
MVASGGDDLDFRGIPLPVEQRGSIAGLHAHHINTVMRFGTGEP